MHPIKQKTGGDAFHGAATGLKGGANRMAPQPFYPNDRRPRKRDRAKVWFRGRVVGDTVREQDRVIFNRPVRFRDHYFRLLGGWGLHTDLLIQLEARGVTHVRNLLDSGSTEIAEFSAYSEHGKPWDYGGKQLVLPREFFAGENGPRTTETMDTEKRTTQQLSLTLNC